MYYIIEEGSLLHIFLYYCAESWIFQLKQKTLTDLPHLFVILSSVYLSFDWFSPDQPDSLAGLAVSSLTNTEHFLPSFLFYSENIASQNLQTVY